MVCQYCEAELTERAMDEGSCPECGASLMGSSLFDDEAVFEEEDEDEFDEFDDDDDDDELIDELDDIKGGMVYDDEFEDDIFEDDDEFENEEAV